jgi:Rha family phage regulatory protein
MTTDLQVVKYGDQLVVDSRQVAEMVGKQHAHLCRDIEGYVTILSQNPILDSDDFFLEDSYTAGTGKAYKCYLLTKKGCDMVANKMTGEKGVLFTAEYINKFYEMEQQLNKPKSQVEMLLQSAQILVEQERKLKEIEGKQQQQSQELQGIREVVTINNSDGWKDKVKNILNKIVRKTGLSYVDIRHESYELLESRCKCRLSVLQTNKRKRLRLAGATRTAQNTVSKIEVIGENPRLTEGYLAVIKDLAISYGVTL